MKEIYPRGQMLINYFLASSIMFSKNNEQAQKWKLV